MSDLLHTLLLDRLLGKPALRLSGDVGDPLKQDSALSLMSLLFESVLKSVLEARLLSPSLRIDVILRSSGKARCRWDDPRSVLLLLKPDLHPLLSVLRGDP